VSDLTPSQKDSVQHLPDPAICRATANVPSYPKCLVNNPAHCDYALGLGSVYFCQHPQKQEIIARTVAETQAEQRGINLNLLVFDREHRQECRLALGDTLDTGALLSVGFKPLGLRARPFIRIPTTRGHSAYMTRNCGIRCFSQTPHPLELGPDQGPGGLWEISSLALFRDDVLRQIAFQLRSNPYAVEFYATKFRKLAEDAIGFPQALSGKLVTWEDGRNVLVSRLKGHDTFVVWVFQV